ncbi:MAG: alginate export family protein [Oligoflexia bacterium]|nr:alginate export family protein [Oligoflexia bacterium]
MRLTVALLTISIVYALSANAQELQPPVIPFAEPQYFYNQFSLKPHILLRGETWDQTDLKTKRSSVLTFLRMKLLYEITPDINVIFTPQYVKIFGSGFNISQTGPTFDIAYGLYETYGSYKFEHWTFTLGRMKLVYGDELVFGSEPWDPLDRLYDGAKFQYENDKLKADVFTLRQTPKKDSINYVNSTGLNSHSEKNMYGVYLNYYVDEWLQEADAYFLYHTQIAPNSLRSEMNISGLRVKSPFKNFDYRGEVTKQINSVFTDLDTAIQFNGELGYTFRPNEKLRLSLEGFLSGRNYIPVFSNIHEAYGLSDVLGFRNLLGYGTHLSANINEKLSVKFDYFFFTRTTADASAYRADGVEILGTLSSSASLNLGSEADLKMQYQLNEVLFANLSGGVFFAGPYFTDQFNGFNRAYFGHLGIEGKF